MSMESQECQLNMDWVSIKWRSIEGIIREHWSTLNHRCLFNRPDHVFWWVGKAVRNCTICMGIEWHDFHTPPLGNSGPSSCFLGFWISFSPQNSHCSFSWGGCEFFLEFYIEILAPLNLVTCRLDHDVQLSLLDEDSKLISMKHGKVNFIYL